VTGPRIVLLGLMGAGKSTVGRLVATRLGYPFVDNDEQVRIRAGRTAREVAEADGLDRLHELEAAALRDALSRPPPLVVTAAASAVAALAGPLAERAFTVWLRARPETLAARTIHDPSRPVLPTGSDRGAAHAAEAMLAAQDRARAAVYGQAADLVIDVDDRRPDEIADLVVAAAGAHR
jgi:shikimate kinase/3-dehydroquinate synthase